MTAIELRNKKRLKIPMLFNQLNLSSNKGNLDRNKLFFVDVEQQKQKIHFFGLKQLVNQKTRIPPTRSNTFRKTPSVSGAELL